MAFGFDASRLLVWLDALVGDDRAKAGALCKRHAERLSVPKGWWLDDRRVQAPELFHVTPSPPPPVPPPPPPPAATRRASRRRRKPPAAESAPPAPPGPSGTELPPPALPENLVPLSGFEEGATRTAPPEITPPVLRPGGATPTAPAAPAAPAAPTAPVDPLLEPSTPLLARAFSGVARPDRPHHRARRGGTNGTNGTPDARGTDPGP